MCIVCDVNTLPSIFSHDENDYSPVRDWVIGGKGKVVYGGTSYLNELSQMTKYNKILKLLGDKNKTVVLEKRAVDRKEREVKSKVNNKCNDPHLIAILAESGCKLVCSNDKQAYPYLSQSDLYTSSHRRPKIYSKKANSNLLCDHNIANCCLPHVKLCPSQANSLSSTVY